MMTNQVREYVMESRWQRERRIRRMWPDNVPVDKSWQVVMMAVTITAVNAVLVIRWFLCV